MSADGYYVSGFASYYEVITQGLRVQFAKCEAEQQNDDSDTDESDDSDAATTVVTVCCSRLLMIILTSLFCSV